MKLFNIIKVGVMILITRVYSYVEEEKELEKFFISSNLVILTLSIY